MSLDTLRDEIGQTLAKEGVAKWLADGDLSKAAVEWMADELAIPKAAGTLLVKGLAQLAAHGGTAAGTWAGRLVTQRVEDWLPKVPGYQKLSGRLGDLAAWLDSEARAKKEFADVLAGRRAASSAEHGKRLSSDLQAHLKGLHGIEAILDRLNPQPRLTLRTLPLDTEGVNRFFFGTQRIPFIGREVEMARLDEFLAADRLFCWWLVLGPGGLGKSRAALELCLRHANDWRVGFLHQNHDVGFFTTWQPDQPTLIVADYAASRPEPLGVIVRTLHEREDLTCPVRILLVERENESKWYSDFRGTGGDGYTIDDAAFRPRPLTFQAFPPRALGEMMTAYLGRDLPDLDTHLATLAEIDHEGRPLFALMMADALDAGREPRQWDKRALVEDVLKREEQKRWIPAGVTDEHKDILAVATINGGMPFAWLKDDAQQIVNPKNNKNLLAAIFGKPIKDHLPAIEPDIVGELFVLNIIGARQGNVIQASAANFSVTDYIQFGRRCATDFPDHEALFAYIDVGEEISASGGWAALVAWMAAIWAQTKNRDFYFKSLEQIEKNAQSPDTDKDFAFLAYALGIRFDLIEPDSALAFRVRPQSSL